MSAHQMLGNSSPGQAGMNAQQQLLLATCLKCEKIYK